MEDIELSRRLRRQAGPPACIGAPAAPFARSNSVFRLFIDKARNQDPITIQGDGSQFRQFTHSEEPSA